MQLWQVPGKRVSQKEQQTIRIKESTNIDMKRKMTVDLTVVNNLVFSHLISNKLFEKSLSFSDTSHSSPR